MSSIALTHAEILGLGLIEQKKARLHPINFLLDLFQPLLHSYIVSLKYSDTETHLGQNIFVYLSFS